MLTWFVVTFLTSGTNCNTKYDVIAKAMNAISNAFLSRSRSATAPMLILENMPTTGNIPKITPTTELENPNCLA